MVYSRVDSSAQWSGIIETIETEPAQNNNNNVYYGGGDSGQQSSKYNFYVTLSSRDGLILGQHVYIQPDLGLDAMPEGLWLPAFYIAHDDTGSYVWAQSDRNTLEKRAVILGEYDSGNDRYQIESGVTEEDYIAAPQEGLEEGNPTTSDITKVPVEDPSVDGSVDGSADGGTMDGGVVDDGFAVMPEVAPESDTALMAETQEDPEDGESGSDDSLAGSPMEDLAR